MDPCREEQTRAADAMPSLVGNPALASWSPFRRWNAGDGAPERLCVRLLDRSFENKLVDSQTRIGSSIGICILRICPFSLLC